MSREQTIVITITRDQLIGDTSPRGPRGNQVIAGSRVMRELRAAGVPVIGSLGLFCVEHGTLSMRMEDGLDGDEFIYAWTGVPLAPHLRKNEFSLTSTLKAIMEKEDEL